MRVSVVSAGSDSQGVAGATPEGWDGVPSRGEVAACEFGVGEPGVGKAGVDAAGAGDGAGPPGGVPVVPLAVAGPAELGAHRQLHDRNAHDHQRQRQ